MQVDVPSQTPLWSCATKQILRMRMKLMLPSLARRVTVPASRHHLVAVVTATRQGPAAPARPRQQRQHERRARPAIAVHSTTQHGAARPHHHRSRGPAPAPRCTAALLSVTPRRAPRKRQPGRAQRVPRPRRHNPGQALASPSPHQPLHNHQHLLQQQHPHQHQLHQHKLLMRPHPRVQQRVCLSP